MNPASQGEKDVYQAAFKHNLGLFLAHPRVDEVLEQYATHYMATSQQVAKALVWFTQNKAREQVQQLLLSEMGSHSLENVDRILALFAPHVVSATIASSAEAPAIFQTLATEFGIAQKQLEEYVYTYAHRNPKPAIGLSDEGFLSWICGEALKELLLEELLQQMASNSMMQEEMHLGAASQHLEMNTSPTDFQTAILSTLKKSPQILSALLQNQAYDSSLLVNLPELTALPREQLEQFLEQARQIVGQASQYVEQLMRVNNYQALVSPYVLQQNPQAVKALVSNTSRKLLQMEEGQADEATAQAFRQQMQRMVQGGLETRKYTHRTVLEKGREATEEETSHFLSQQAQDIPPLTSMKGILLSEKERPVYTDTWSQLQKTIATIAQSYVKALSMLLRQIFFRRVEYGYVENLKTAQDKLTRMEEQQQHLEIELKQKERELDKKSRSMLAKFTLGNLAEEVEDLESTLIQLQKDWQLSFEEKIDCLFYLRALNSIQEVLIEAFTQFYFQSFRSFMIKNRRTDVFPFTFLDFLAGEGSARLSGQMVEILQTAFPLGGTKLQGVLDKQALPVSDLWQYLNDTETRKTLQGYDKQAMAEKHQEIVASILAQLIPVEGETERIQSSMHMAIDGFLELVAHIERYLLERYEEKVFMDTGNTRMCSLENYFITKSELLNDYMVELVGKAEDKNWSIEVLNTHDPQATHIFTNKINADVMGDMKDLFAVDRYRVLSQIYPSREKSQLKTHQGLRFRQS